MKPDVFPFSKHLMVKHQVSDVRSGLSIKDPNSTPPRPPSPLSYPAPRGKTHQDDNVWPEQDTNNPRSSIFLGSDIQQKICRCNRTEDPLTKVRVCCEHVRTPRAPKPLSMKSTRMDDKMGLVPVPFLWQRLLGNSRGSWQRPAAIFPQNPKMDKGRFLCYKKLESY